MDSRNQICLSMSNVANKIKFLNGYKDWCYYGILDYKERITKLINMAHSAYEDLYYYHNSIDHNIPELEYLFNELHKRQDEFNIVVQEIHDAKQYYKQLNRYLAKFDKESKI